MTEQIFPWEHSRPFNAYYNYFKKQFWPRVQKLYIDEGFTCPNRDGAAGYGGCTFCCNQAFNPSYCQKQQSVYVQLEEGIKFHEWRYKKATDYLAYFQAFSNTYAPLEKLKDIYSQALEHPKVVGLVIGTRPDCVDEEKLDYFRQLAEQYYVIVEYGIESCYNKTLERVNRGHDFEKTQWAIEETAKRGLKVGGHLIFGLPGESREMLLAEAKIISKLPLTTVKFHQLQIFKDTPMEKEYQEKPQDFHLFELDEYIDFVVDFVERLNPNIVIERFAGEVPPRFQAGPNWGLIRNEKVFSLIENRFKERNTWQGRLWKGE